MSKTLRYTGKPGARMENQESGIGIEDRLKKLGNKINK